MVQTDYQKKLTVFFSFSIRVRLDYFFAFSFDSIFTITIKRQFFTFYHQCIIVVTFGKRGCKATELVAEF
jgi:hypothetical protein